MNIYDVHIVSVLKSSHYFQEYNLQFYQPELVPLTLTFLFQQH